MARLQPTIRKLRADPSRALRPSSLVRPVGPAVHTAGAHAVKDGEGREGPVIPDWRFVLKACSAADAVKPPSSLVGQEALLATCTAPVPWAELVQAAASSGMSNSSCGAQTVLFWFLAAP
jgi:hypothetical protein